MKTKKLKYKVTSNLNDDIANFYTKKDCNDYIKCELNLANVYEIRNPYTKEDFYITKN